MSQPTNDPATSAAQQWDEEVVFQALSHTARRKMLLQLARKGPQTAADLYPGNQMNRDIACKHLKILRSAGLVTTQENSLDGRRLLYALTPVVPLRKTEEGCVIDFGFCMFRLK